MYETLRDMALNTNLYNEQAQVDCFGTGESMSEIVNQSRTLNLVGAVNLILSDRVLHAWRFQKN